MTCGLCGEDQTTGFLCPRCTTATGRRLDNMPRLYEELAEFLRPGSRRPEFGRSTVAAASMPIAEAPLTLRGPGGIVGVLEDWRSAMQAARGWDEPVIQGSIGRRIAVAARALSINLEWIAGEWSVAGQLAVEILRLERQALAVIDPDDPAERPMKLGPCPRAAGDEACGADLVRLPGQSLIQCHGCGTSWPPARWVDLGEAQRARAAA